MYIPNQWAITKNTDPYYQHRPQHSFFAFFMLKRTNDIKEDLAAQGSKKSSIISDNETQYIQ